MGKYAPFESRKINHGKRKKREGSFLSEGATTLAMRGKSGLAMARISESSTSVDGSGEFAYAQLATSCDQIAIEVVMIDSNGNLRSGVVSCTVVEDFATGIELILAPNPLTVNQPIDLIVRSDRDPIVSAEAMIYDPVGHRLFHEHVSGSQKEILFTWEGVSGGSGSFKVIVKCITESGKTAVLSDMIGQKR